jgi:hypothetical protein
MTSGRLPQVEHDAGIQALNTATFPNLAGPLNRHQIKFFGMVHEEKGVASAAPFAFVGGGTKRPAQGRLRGAETRLRAGAEVSASNDQTRPAGYLFGRSTQNKWPSLFNRALRWHVAKNDDSDRGDCPNDDRSNDYGDSEHRRRAESQCQPEASANGSRLIKLAMGFPARVLFQHCAYPHRTTKKCQVRACAGCAASPGHALSEVPIARVPQDLVLTSRSSTFRWVKSRTS